MLQANGTGFREAFAELKDEIAVLRAYAAKRRNGAAPSGLRADDPLEDAYAAALAMRTYGDWDAGREDSLYRGQRNHVWPVVPSIHRKEPDGRPADVPGRRRWVESFAARLRERRPGLSWEQAVAVAQHYSKAAKTPTWLVDVTWDPLVALFFATDGGKRCHKGVVDHIVIPDWRRLVAEGPAIPAPSSPSRCRR